jgi:hypothetical protein
METAMHRLLLTACLLALPPAALASTIYKVQMPDGSIMYTDTVPAGGKILEEREAKARPRSPAPAPRAAVGEGTQRIVAPPLSPREADKLDTAVNEVAEAERALSVARRKLEVGREPLPGERLGLAGGGSRLSPEYESRQRMLEAEVASAEMRLKRAYDSRNAARQ